MARIDAPETRHVCAVWSIQRCGATERIWSESTVMTMGCESAAIMKTESSDRPAAADHDRRSC
ncbi:hypothetical protein T31B1_00790 [Salinisphaera sp. T31B1]